MCKLLIQISGMEIEHDRGRYLSFTIVNSQFSRNKSIQIHEKNEPKIKKRSLI